MAEQIAQHPATGKRVVQMQFVDLAHQPQILVRDRARMVVDRAAADAQDFGLLLDGKIVLGIDHRLALSSSAFHPANEDLFAETRSWSAPLLKNRSPAPGHLSWRVRSLRLPTLKPK
jgi:hypothetical protein